MFSLRLVSGEKHGNNSISPRLHHPQKPLFISVCRIVWSLTINRKWKISSVISPTGRLAGLPAVTTPGDGGKLQGPCQVSKCLVGKLLGIFPHLLHDIAGSTALRDNHPMGIYTYHCGESWRRIKWNHLSWSCFVSFSFCSRYGGVLSFRAIY